MKNKSPLRILSAVALLAFSGIGMVACNSGVTGEPPETTIEDTRAYNIWFDDELSANSTNVEIQKGSRFLLWQHISVPDGTYELEARTENIKIDKHVIQALDYGDFRVVIHAVGSNGKKLTRSISGKVISEEKAQFNEYWKTMQETNRYRVSSEFSNTVVHLGDEAYEYLAGTNSKTGSDVYGGAVYDKATSHWYSYSYDSAKPSALEIDPGYGLSITDFKTQSGLAGVKTFNWVEVMDANGAGTGKFFLQDDVTEENGYLYSNVVDPLYINMFSDIFGNWISLVRSEDIAARGMIASLEGDGIKLVPAKSETEAIESFEKEDLASYVTEIGETANAAVEAWAAKPTYPKQVNTTLLGEAFAQIEAEKNYTITTRGLWVNPNTGYATTAPEKSDGTFEPFSSTTMVDGDMKVNIVGLSSANQINFINMSGLDEGLFGGTYTIPETGTVTATYIKDGKLHMATGTISEDYVITYEAPKTGSDLASLWGHAGTAEEPKGYTIVSEGIQNLLPLVSFSGSSNSSSGTTFVFNTCGDDLNADAKQNLFLVSWSDGQKFGGIKPSIYMQESDYLALNMSEIFSFLFGAAGNEFYITSYFLIDSDSITLMEILPYSNDGYYVMETVWSNIGSTIIDNASQALLK